MYLSNTFRFLALLGTCCLLFACSPESKSDQSTATSLIIQAAADGESFSVFRPGSSEALLTQVSKPDFRPYLHPIMSPDGSGQLTEYSPGHHKHQTGLYWGFTRVNGRDYFHHPEGDYWRKVSAQILTDSGEVVRWQTVYEMLDEEGEVVMAETQSWSSRLENGKLLLELEWEGKAETDVTIGKYDYGGLFLRMPWQEGIQGEVVNAARQRNEQAEGQRAMWVDVGMEIEGRDDWGHIAIFDHPNNAGFPNHWRVDGQLGIGPATARTSDWTIKAGESRLIRHQLVAYSGELNDITLTRLWENFSGQEGMYSTAALWGIAQREGREAKFLKPEEAVAAMSLKAGYEANVWAGEPMITQPMAFCWDDRGRLWVAENRDYESRGHGFSKYGDSRIVILEDTDHDGQADSRKVFLEGIPFPAAIAVGFDGLFLGAPPNLLFVPDRDQDDRADTEDIEVRLTGWGIRDRHETLNSFHWGPDGWLYGCEGFATPSKVRKPTGKGRIYRPGEAFPEDLLEADGTDIDGGVWRYHPTKDRFEVVAHGFSNPWGIDHDAKGQLFITACVIPHLWHVIPGGIYHRQGGQHFNPYVYQDLKTIADHRHRSAHGGARIYQSDAFPAEQQGRIFMANIHEHAILSDLLEPKGSGYASQHGEDFLLANNAQWIGFSLEIGPDGALYVLDWHDADICGKEVLNKETGRIFRISPTNSQAENWPGRYENLKAMSDEELVALQSSPSDWHARRARLILQQRATQGKISAAALTQLEELFAQTSPPDHRLRAMWSLQQTGHFSAQNWQSSLKDDDPYVRGWAIQLLCEDGVPDAEVLSQFAQLAETDPSPVVRLYLASALQRLPLENRWPITEALLTHAEDATDHNLPGMIWYGSEPLLVENPSRALALAANSRLPQLSEFFARRAVDAGETELLVAEIGQAKSTRPALLRGLLAGLEGRSDAVAPKNWSEVYEQIRQESASKELALAIAQRFGDREAARQALANLRNAKMSLAQRTAALQALAAQQAPELVAELPALLTEPNLRLTAIQAVAAYESEALGKQVLQAYPRWNEAEQAAAIQTLAARPRYGRLLTQAIADESIPRRDIPAYVVRQLRRVVGNGFVEVWGPIDQWSGDLSATYAKYRALLQSDAIAQADAAKGEAIFQRTCGACHQMYGKGGQLGPDLTGANRGNVEYLLGNILDPSGEIQDDYRMTVLTTRDGRTYLGTVVSETDRQLSLRTVGQDELVLNLSDIQSREISETSMMPQGLLQPLTDQEVLDLMGYLGTQKALRVER